MKTTGIVRNVDNLGRIALPIEIRDNMDIDSKDPLEIYTDEDKIIFKKYETGCHFCGNEGDNIIHKDKQVCKSCLKELKEEFINSGPLIER